MNSRDLRQLREHYQDRDALHRRPALAGHADSQCRCPVARYRKRESNQAGAAHRVRPLHHRPAFPRTADARPRQPLAGSRDDPRACGDGDVHPPGPACPAPVVLPAVHQQSVPGRVRGDRGAQRGIRRPCARGNRRLRVRIPLAACRSTARISGTSRRTTRCSSRGRTSSRPISTLYRPIQELFRQANAAGRRRLARARGAVLDLSQFITQAAIETFIAEDDGVLGYAGMNNFYLYRSAGSTAIGCSRGTRTTRFSSSTSPCWTAPTRTCCSGGRWRTRTCESAISRSSRTAREARPRRTGSRREIERQVSLIGDAAHEDPLKQFSNEEFDRQIEFLREFATHPLRVRAGRRSRPSARETARRDSPAPGEAGFRIESCGGRSANTSLPPDPNRVRSPSSDD